MSLPAPDNKADRRVRVMIVDDSSVVRGLTRRWLEADARINIVKLCTDGAQAVAEAAAANPHVIVLDVEMPNMDGLTALPHLRKVVPNARIIMASTLTSKGASVTIKALTLGAADYIAKPESSSLGGADSYKNELIAKIVALGERATAGPVRPSQFKLRQPPLGVWKPQIMVVAASTGGPNALQTFLAPIAKRITAPILIVQHMPATFTTIFADKLSQVMGKQCREAKDGDVIGNNTVLLAPGDFHLRVARDPAGRVARLDKGDPVNYCRPAADPLFDTASALFGPRVLCVVLTGMGSDGKNGAGKIADAGGRVIVQDEASSVVWGMPGAVAMAGHAEAVRPLKDLSQLALTLMNGDAA